MPYFFIYLFAILVCDTSELSAQETFQRDVMILYDSNTGQSPMDNIIFSSAQNILDYYGLICDYRDINDTFPDSKDMTPYRAIITALNSDVTKNAKQYLTWLLRQFDEDKKVIVFGTLGGADQENKEPEVLKLRKAIFYKLGLDYQGSRFVVQNRIHYAKKIDSFFNFERSLPIFPTEYEKFKVVDQRTKQWLIVTKRDEQDSESAVVITHPFGGLALKAYLIWEGTYNINDMTHYQRQWRINPFVFLEESLGLQQYPRPDFTTINGLRVAFSHIDGDAFLGVSRIESNKTCGEIIMEKVLEKYDFPVTASLIIGQIDPLALGNVETEALAKKLFAMPNIEPASHSYSHPFYWDTSFTFKDRYESQYGIKIPNYEMHSEKEINYSINYITKSLAPKNKPCRVMQWSGNCLPREGDLKLCRTANVLNINCGDTIFDDLNNSYTSVAPFFRKVGNEYQIFAAIANENILTNLWLGPYYGYAKIIRTLEKTNMPRRIKPIDIYYHFYSGEYKASLKALQDVYEWSLGQDTVRMYTSQYLEIANGFLSAQIYKQGQDKWQIENYNKCLTIRFDNETRIPDLSESENIIGYTLEPQGLYISLAYGKPKAVIKLINPDSIKIKPIPYIKKATGWITDFTVSDKTINIKYEGFGKGWIQISGLISKSSYSVEGAAIADFNKGNAILSATEEGVLTIAPIKTGSLILTKME